MRVAAENENGRGGWSEKEIAMPAATSTTTAGTTTTTSAATTTTEVTLVPETPSGLVVQEHYRRLTLNWTGPSESEVTSYLIELHADDGIIDRYEVSHENSNEISSKEFLGLVSGKTYQVKLFSARDGVYSKPFEVLAVPLDRVTFVSNLNGQDAIYYADFSTRDLVIQEGRWDRVTDSETVEGSPNMSPDGSWVAFHRRHPDDTHWQIFLKHIDTGEERQLICGSDNGWSPTWSPDGGSVAFARGSGGNDIWVIDVETGDAQSLKDKFDADDAYPSWSPDGDTIAFARRDYDARRSRTYNSRNRREIRILTGVMSGAETELGVTRLTNHEEGDYSAPDWSPKDEKIAYSISPTGSSDRHIDVMDRDGNKLQQLTREHYDDDPSWSPDGEWIAFARGMAGSRDLYVVSTDDGDSVPEPVPLLLHGGFDYSAPSWSPNRDVGVNPTFDCRS